MAIPPSTTAGEALAIIVHMAGEIANRERPPVRVTLRRERERPLRAGEPVSTEQRAEIELPESALERLWNAEALERLARSYWAFLERISLRLLRVRYYPDGRAVTLLGLLPLLRFHAPEYEFGHDFGAITWRIRDGLLVSRSGRDRGWLRLSVQRLPRGCAADSARLLIVSRVESFVPRLALAGRRGRWLRRIGVALYAATQLRIHRWVTHAFFRSLARGELPRSVVGRFASAAAASVP